MDPARSRFPECPSRDRQRAREAEWRRQNPERVKASHDKWTAANKERRREISRLSARRRRARIAATKPKLSLEEQFWAKVDKDGPVHPTLNTCCWLWTGARSTNGYGTFGTGYAHRASYELAYGGITNGLWVLHRCDNRPCVNPAHLFLGTHQDNMRDMKEKGRNNTAWSDMQRAKTHCIRGHPFDAENTYFSGKQRSCRQCRRDWERANYQRIYAAKKARRANVA